MKFWFDNGVSGLRIDAVGWFIEDALFRDESLLNPSLKKDEYMWRDYNHEYTYELWETFEVVHEFRLFVDEINEKEGGAERYEYK